MVRKKGGCCRADEACIHKEDSTWWFLWSLSDFEEGNFFSLQLEQPF
jgi:hypothetical protein